VNFSSGSHQAGQAGFIVAIFAVVAGGVLALAAGALLLKREVAPAIVALSLAVALLTLGLMAFGATWSALRDADRDSHHVSPHARRAGMAIYLIMLIALLAAAIGAGLELARQPLAPPTRIVGQVEHLHPNDPRRGSPRVSLKLDSHARWLEWTCSFFCGPFEEMKRLGDKPWPVAEAEVYGTQIVGLTLDGRRYLDPEDEVARRRRDAWASFALMCSLLAASALFGVVWLRRRPRPYTAPDPTKSAAKAMMRRQLSGGRSKP